LRRKHDERPGLAIGAVVACLGLLPLGCYDGKGEGGGATDGMGTDGMDDGDGDGSDDGPAEPPPENVDLVPESQARRLSQAELDNTLADLVAEDTRPARTYIAEDEFAPYDNDYSLQLVSRTLIESMEVLSIDVAKRLI
jgi:hypothetical protein